MNTLFFKHLLEVERTGSISRAADNLFMAQPNLSKEIKEIETDIGFAIFFRNSKGVQPTAQGKKYLAYARNIVRQLERLDGLSQPEQLNAQVLSMALPRSAYLAQALTDFVSRLNLGVGLDIRVRETDAVQAISYLEDGWCNLGIIRYNQRYEPAFQDLIVGKKLTWQPLWSFDNVVTFSQSHSLARAELLQYEQLLHFPELVPGDMDAPFLAMENNSPAVPVKVYDSVKKIYIYDRANAYELLSWTPMAYMLTDPVPEDVLMHYRLIQKRCQLPNNTYKDVLVLPQGYRQTEMETLFMDCVAKAREKMDKRVQAIIKESGSSLSTVLG